MANFNININAEPSPSYKPSYNKIRQVSCDTGTTDYKLGIVKNAESDTDLINFLLKEYTGVSSWKTLRVSNIAYNHTLKFYLKYNGSKLVPNQDPDVVVADIDITSVNINEDIPLFYAVFNNDTFSKNETITFDLEIIDTNDNSLGKVNVGIIGIYVECIPPAEDATVRDSFTAYTECSSRKSTTVRVPSGSSKYVYAELSDGSCSISGLNLPTTITSNETFTMTISGSDQGQSSVYSSIRIYVKETPTATSIQASSSLTRNHTGNNC